MFRDTLNDPGNADILANWVGESDLLATIPVSTVNAAANPFFIVDGEITLGSNVPDAWAATVRTIRYAVDAENIYFIEN